MCVCVPTVVSGCVYWVYLWTSPSQVLRTVVGTEAPQPPRSRVMAILRRGQEEEGGGRRALRSLKRFFWGSRKGEVAKAEGPGEEPNDT